MEKNPPVSSKSHSPKGRRKLKRYIPQESSAPVETMDEEYYNVNKGFLTGQNFLLKKTDDEELYAYLTNWPHEFKELRLQICASFSR